MSKTTGVGTMGEMGLALCIEFSGAAAPTIFSQWVQTLYLFCTHNILEQTPLSSYIDTEVL